MKCNIALLILCLSCREPVPSDYSLPACDAGSVFIQPIDCSGDSLAALLCAESYEARFICTDAGEWQQSETESP